MQVVDLERLYDYSKWANDRLFNAMAALTDAQFTQDVAGSYGSVRNTLVHAVSAEWGWLDRSGGRKRGPKLEPGNYPNLASLRAAWDQVHGYVREFLATLDDGDLDRVVEYSMTPSTRRSMPIGEMLHHAVVHSVHHRGQAGLLLRMIGVKPPDMDILLFYAELRGVEAI